MAADDDSRASAEQLQLELERLRDKFAAGFPQRFETIRESWSGLLGGVWDIESARSFHRTVHGLVGTAGSLGFGAVARSARLLERVLVPLLEGEDGPDAGIVKEIEALFDRLGKSPAVDKAASFSFDVDGRDYSPPIFEPRNLIVVVQQGEPFAGELAQQLGHFGFELQMFDKLDEVVANSVGRRPAAVITDLSSPDGELLAVDVAAEVREVFGADVPLVLSLIHI